jgi:hypothetical protein
MNYLTRVVSAPVDGQFTIPLGRPADRLHHLTRHLETMSWRILVFLPAILGPGGARGPARTYRRCKSPGGLRGGVGKLHNGTA